MYRLTNSSSNIVVVSVSKFVKRTRLRVTLAGSSILLTKSSTCLNRVWAQRGLGKPKMPEEMAGMETDSHLRKQAQTSVALMQLPNSSTSLRRP